MRSRLALLLVGVLAGVLGTTTVQIAKSHLGGASDETTQLAINGVGITLPAGGPARRSIARLQGCRCFVSGTFPSRNVLATIRGRRR